MGDEPFLQERNWIVRKISSTRVRKGVWRECEACMRLVAEAKNALRKFDKKNLRNFLSSTKFPAHLCRVEYNVTAKTANGQCAVKKLTKEINRRL